MHHARARAWICVALLAVCAQFSTDAGEAAAARVEPPHWSLRQPVSTVLPEFSDPAERAWLRTPVDAFILARLKEAGLRPAHEADRRTLIRRLSFDLTGLPPTPGEIDAFLADRSGDAYEQLLERLLASPHYGERWGQHWLDVVRFAETEGFEYDRHLAGAWRYRDYVIQSFHEDRPYDEFVAEQLAGDELAPDDPASRIAVGFYRLGPVRRNAGNPDVALSRNEVLTTRTDIIGSAFLGVTLGCARCHDHKFDPIPQKDYYRMQAFLAATDDEDISLANADDEAAWKAATQPVLEAMKKVKESLKGAQGSAKRELEAKLEELEDSLPPPLPAICSTRNNEAKRTAVHVLRRGDEGKPGEAVGMRLLSMLLPQESPELPADAEHPRTALARSITDRSNPLTARVLVNRVWQWHFGIGLVGTANDFGANGERPSHPGLLDFLATRFVADGWRLKPLHHMICLSNSYRQASRASDPERSETIDPNNRLLSRFGVRRLEAEELRDAMLAVSGRLNRKAAGPGVIVPVDEQLVKLLYKPAQWSVTRDPSEHQRRSIYLIAKRNLRLPFLEVFDQPALQTSCARRESSTHAPQALELLNGRLSNELAAAFAERLREQAGAEPARQMELAFLLAAGRPPTGPEASRALAFLAQHPLSEFALALFNLNAFLYVE